ALPRWRRRRRARSRRKHIPDAAPHARCLAEQHAWGRAQVLPHVRFRRRLAVAVFCMTRTTDLDMNDIQSLTRQAVADIDAAETPDALEALRVALLGKHGSITAQLKALGGLPADQRKAAGEAINRA